SMRISAVVDISGGHPATAFGALAASIDAFLHIADPLAVSGALGADLGTFRTDMPMMLGADKHEVRRSATYLGASHHQGEMRLLDMLASHFQAMVHGGGQTRRVAA